MNFCADRLIETRENLGISKSEAARRLNMSAMGYGRYESGERQPSFQTVSMIADVLGTSVDYLYGNTDDSTPDSIKISASSSPELFVLVEKLKSADTDMLKRLLQYYQLLSSQEDSLPE